MTRPGIATVAFTLAFCAGLATASAQERLPAADTPEPNTLQHLEAPYLKQEQQQPPQQQHQTSRSAGRYFIDFRSRSALTYGHSFVVFGRVGEKITAKNVAGLHPRGDSSITYMVGHVLPVESETGASDGDLDEKYMTARYRVMLTPSQYHAVVRQIRDLQANSPMWHAATFNCNAFVGTIAHFVGLSSPPPWLFPEDFINSLNRMNDGRTFAMMPEARDAMARHSTARRTVAR